MISNPFLFYFFIVVLAMIYKFFLKKGGIILKMDGIVPKKAGIREKESEWAPLVSKIGILALVIFLFDLFARFIQQEAEKIHQQIGTLH